MPESRKRPGHHEFHQSADIPAKERVKGSILWTILLGVFGAIMAYFASNGNIAILLAGALVGAVIGFFIGKKMEESSRK